MKRAFWSLLADGLGHQRRAEEWESVLGVEALRTLLQAGLLGLRPARPGGEWPCGANGGPGCARWVETRRGLTAICGLSPAVCRTEPLPDGAALIAVERPAFLAQLAAALGVEAQVTESLGPRPVVLGERALGPARLCFLWVDRPRWSGLEDALTRTASATHGAPLVLLVAHPRQLPAAPPRGPTGAPWTWIDLADGASWRDGRLTLDLAELILALAPPIDLGPALWPRYALVIDQRRDQVWYGGRPVRPTGMGTRFLERLATRPGDVVTRRAMILTLWGDEIQSRGSVPVEHYDQRLRQIRSGLGKAFRESGPPDALPPDPVELVRGEEDLRAGYRLALPEGRRTVLLS